MKIFMYEVAPEDKAYIDEFSKELKVEISATNAVPTLENAEFVKGFDGVSFCGQGQINAALLDRYKEYGIGCISTRIIGYNHIDLEHAKKIGLKVCNANYAPNGVADYTVMLMLMCLRKYDLTYKKGLVNDFTLDEIQGREIKDLTIGIMGTGRIGLQVIKNLSGFGCRIICFSPHVNPAVSDCAKYVSREELFKTADVITLHMAYSPETYHIIDDSAVSLMKDGVVIINCARGELADTNSLIKGLKSGKISALGLDTVESEEGIIRKNHEGAQIINQTYSTLRQLDNVIVTPHIAFHTDAAARSMVRCGIEGLYKLYTEGSCETQL